MNLFAAECLEKQGPLKMGAEIKNDNNIENDGRIKIWDLRLTRGKMEGRQRM